MPRVGIYVPAWNAEKYIGEMIASVRNQTFDDWTMVILDDASDDRTVAAAAEAAHGDSRISISSPGTHCGLIGKLKNEAISQLPDTEFICHVGSEDKISPDCLELFVRFMDAHPDLGAACGSFLAFDDSGKKWMFPHVARDRGFDSERLLRYMCMYPMRFYRRDAVEKVGGYSNELSSSVDYDLALRLDENVKIGRLEDRVTYFYRQHPQQVSRRARPQQNLNAKKALQDALDRRGLEQTVVNDAPPFRLEDKLPDHFIWRPE